MEAAGYAYEWFINFVGNNYMVDASHVIHQNIKYYVTPILMELKALLVVCLSRNAVLLLW